MLTSWKKVESLGGAWWYPGGDLKIARPEHAFVFVFDGSLREHSGLKTTVVEGELDGIQVYLEHLEASHWTCCKYNPQQPNTIPIYLYTCDTCVYIFYHLNKTMFWFLIILTHVAHDVIRFFFWFCRALTLVTTRDRPRLCWALRGSWILNHLKKMDIALDQLWTSKLFGRVWVRQLLFSFLFFRGFSLLELDGWSEVEWLSVAEKKCQLMSWLNLWWPPQLRCCMFVCWILVGTKHTHMIYIYIWATKGLLDQGYGGRHGCGFLDYRIFMDGEDAVVMGCWIKKHDVSKKIQMISGT